MDIVTSRTGNLHNEMVQVMNQSAVFSFPGNASLYAAAYRPLKDGDTEQIEVWPVSLALGQPLQTMPLYLNAQICLGVDLEATYQDACRRRRIG